MEKEAIREIFRSSLQPHGFKGLIENDGVKSVGIYMRVAVPGDSSVHSLELQKQHYKNLLETVPKWNLYRFYIDEGTAQTSFKEMIADAQNHLIGLILTRSLSRFSSNLTDGIEKTKELARLIPPVGVLFESEYLFSLEKSSQVFLETILKLEKEKSV